MPRTCCEESRTIERFRDRYGSRGSEAERAIELAAIGANVGANGYTTVAQAEELARRLKLTRRTRLLDVGCGRGYPGLYIARIAGCDVVSSDLPIASLRTARRRASRDRISRRASFIAASAVHPPLRPGTFDAIVHTDVLCCLRAKLAVLRACHHLLKPGGRMAFTTIYAGKDVGDRDYRRACRVRGCGFAERREVRALVESAGFVNVREKDVTREFARTTRAYLEMSAMYRDELRAQWGSARFVEWQRDREATLELTERGVVRRGLFTAARRER